MSSWQYDVNRLAEECGISVAEIEFYRKEGLFTAKLHDGQRFTEDDRLRLQVVAKAAKLGFSPLEIKMILGFKETPRRLNGN